MTKFNLKTNASYAFKAPNIDADANKKVESVFPTAEAISVEYQSVVVLNIHRATTIVDFGVLDGNMDISAEVGQDVPIGAILVAKYQGGASDANLTSGDGMSDVDITAVAGVTGSFMCIYDGEAFINVTTKPAEVSPPAPVESISASPTSLVFLSAGETKEVQVTATSPYTVTHDLLWVEQQKGVGVLSITASLSAEGPRSGEIVLALESDPTKQVTISVKQEGSA